MMRNQGDGAPTAALLAALLLGLLALAERAGLPLPYVKIFLVAAALFSYAALVALSRTSREGIFIGAGGLAAPVQAGLAIAAAVWLTVDAFQGPPGPASWLAAAVGAPLGMALAHGVDRFAARRLPAAEPEPAGWIRIPVALLAGGAGLLTLIVGLEAARHEVARLLGVGETAALALTAAVILLPTLLGGARGALALAGAGAVVAATVLLALVLMGIAWIGTLPLPGQSEHATLLAIADARDRWGIALPVHLTNWPSAAALLGREALLAGGLAFATAAALALSAAPAAPIRRRATAATAALALALLPPLTAAVAGYAIEAAGTRFVGASLARPPPALVETAALGLVRVCGAAAASAEALRAACKVGPRDPATLETGQIALEPAFLRSGLPATLGLPATVALAAGGLQLALALSAAAMGLWIAARAIGRGLLGRRRQAPGLASLRQGLIRVAALALLAAAAAVVTHKVVVPREAAFVLVAASLLLAAARLFAATRKPMPAEPAVPPPRRAGRASAQSEAA